ncbi:12146_t:CDS:2, partial [Cetraspora pellucida]
MSSASGPSSLASSSTSFLIEDTEDIEYSDSEDEYMLLLTFHRTSLENQDSDHSNDDYVKVDTSSACKRKCKSAEVTQQKLPLPPNFDPYIHSKSLHQAFVHLPLQHEVVKSIDIFLLFFPINMLDTIVVNTNLYALTKNASAFRLFKSPSLKQYWNEDTRFPFYHISRQMTLKRFEQIKRYLHISSPAETINHYFEKLELCFP